jgi:hypothetical protein
MSEGRAMGRRTRRILREPARSLLASFGVKYSERARNYELESALERLPSFDSFEWVIN